ncbi:MAG: hypothetical protein LC723_08985 [Actinobacteria bacterium]|nr:hypothetical protein [Actinomycetota bacterium]
MYTCDSCGGRIITFENVSEGKCPDCGSVASATAGLRISIPLGLEDFPELKSVTASMREDLVRLSGLSLVDP